MRKDCTYLHLPNCERVMRLSEEAKYFIYLVIKRMQIKCVNNKGFTYLRSVDLKEIYLKYSYGTRRWKYTDVLKELEGIIETDYKWRKGVRSKGYKLTEEIANYKVIGYQMPEGKFKKRILKIAEKKRQKDGEEMLAKITNQGLKIRKGTELLAKEFLDRNNERLGIKEEEALAFINNPEKIRNIIEKNEKTRSKKSPKQKETDIWNNYAMKIDNIARGNYATTKISKTSRYFNDLTNFPKATRKFIFDKNSPYINLFELDIKNSQPFCVNILIYEYYRNRGNKVNSLCGDILEKMPIDVKFYTKLVCDGEIYEYFMARLGIDKDKRGEFKINFYKSFFFCKPIKCDRKILKVFEEDFPNVLKVIRFYKSYECKSVQKIDDDLVNDKNKIHCNFIRRLQKIESKLMIGKVIRRIAKERGEMFALTIHDSIICGESNVDYVEKVMNEELMKEFGMVPQIGKKRIVVNEVKMEMAG